MNSTAKVDFNSTGKKWSDIVAHVKRLHKNGHYSNKNIDVTKSEYNYSNYIHDAKKDNEKYFMPYILLQNIRKASTGHKNEIYSSVHDYFQHRKYSNQRNSIFEIGNQDYRKKYYKILENKGLTTKQIRKVEARSLVDDVKEYDANSSQSVGAYSVNCDESTAHIHFQNLSYPNREKLARVSGNKPINLMPRSKKWKRKMAKILGLSPDETKGFIKLNKFNFYKPSASFNNTWRLEFPNAKNKSGQFDSRKALHLANNKYSKMIIRNFNKELIKQTGIHGFKLHLIRTHNINNQNYKEFLSSKIANDKLKKVNTSLSTNNKGLQANQTNITKSFASSALTDIKPNISLAIKSGSQSASTSASLHISGIITSINASNDKWQSSMTSSAISATESIKNKDKSLTARRNSINIQQSNLNSELKRHKDLSNKNYDLSAQVTKRKGTLVTLKSKIKGAKKDLKKNYHHIIYDLLDDVLPRDDPSFNFCKATKKEAKSKHGFSSRTLKEYASGTAQIQVGNHLYSGIGAVLHMISYDIWHSININGVNKAKQDSKYKAKAHDEFENRQIEARAKDDGKTWPD